MEVFAKFHDLWRSFILNSISCCRVRLEKKTTEAGFQNQLIPFFGNAPIVVIFAADILYYVISLSTKFYNFWISFGWVSIFFSGS